MMDLVSQIPREKLKALVEKNGDGLLHDADRCEGLLKDHCGAYRREISALVGAVQERIPVELKSSWQTAMTPEAMRARLVQRLEENRGLAPEVANWAVDAWSYALGVGLGRRSAGVEVQTVELPAEFSAGASLASGSPVGTNLGFGPVAEQPAFAASVSQRVASDRAGGTLPAAPQQVSPKASTKMAGIGALAVLGLAIGALALIHRPAPAPAPDPGNGGGSVHPKPILPAPKPAPRPDGHDSGRVTPPDTGSSGSRENRPGPGDDGGGSRSPKPVPVAASTAEMRQATDRMIDLKARADAALSGVQQIRRQQQAQGYDMRGDVLASVSRMQSFLGEANRALNQRDARAANGYMQKAETEVAALEKFLGR